MPRCDYCGKEIVFPYKCSDCNRIFCAEHRIAESHECPCLSEVKTPLSPPTYRKPSIDSLGRCPDCNTYAISELYYDADTMTFKCRACGHIWTQLKRDPHEIVEMREKQEETKKPKKKKHWLFRR